MLGGAVLSGCTGELFATLISNVDLQRFQLEQNLLVVPERLFALPPTTTPSKTAPIPSSPGVLTDCRRGNGQEGGGGGGYLYMRMTTSTDRMTRAAPAAKPI